MHRLELNYRSRKALTVHLGEAASAEIINFLEQLTERIEQLERGKVDVMPIVPATPAKKVVPRQKAA